MRILVISSGKGEEAVDLKKKAEKAGHKVLFRNVETTDFDVEKDDYDIVYWRSSPVTKYYKNTVGRSVLMQRFNTRVPVVNGVLAEQPLITHKSYQQAYLKRTAGFLKGIDTHLARTKQQLREHMRNGTLTLPFIAKPDRGSQGKQVELIESISDLKNIKKCADYVFQNYIPNDCDYRVFVVGGVAVDVVRRRPTARSTKQYLNNMSQGGTAEKVDDTTLYYTLARKAETIAAVFDLTVCGVDLIQNSETGDIHFMEINTAPQWVCFERALSVDVGREILDTLVRLATREEDVSVHTVRRFYENHQRALSPSKRFHFFSRVYLWSGEQKYFRILAELKQSWLGSPERYQSLAQSIPTLSPPSRSGGRAYRETCYRRHHKIYKYNAVFFKALFLREIFHDDTYATIIDAIDLADLKEVRRQLLADQQSVFVLSTHAINFLYHAEDFFGLRVQPKTLLRIGACEKLDDPMADREARLYMYTHAIIGASRFYSREHIRKHRRQYLKILRCVDEQIASAYPLVSIDQKCEAVVCARILGATLSMEAAIRAEVNRSVSRQGDFVIDQYNVHAGKTFKNGFIASEHRSVLAVMAFGDNFD